VPAALIDKKGATAPFFLANDCSNIKQGKSPHEGSANCACREFLPKNRCDDPDIRLRADGARGILPRLNS
jgi:hypothetical protein